MKVSIIVPVYNTSLFLERCLESVFKQTYKNIEVIVVNDGSTDNSNDILISLQQKYAFLYLDKKNGGLSSARNEGLRYVTEDSTFVFFLDSDDYLAEDAIENLIKESNGNDIIIGNYCYVYPDNTVRKKLDFKFSDLVAGKMSDYEYFDYFYGGLYGINACNKLYRMQLFLNSKLLFQPNNEIYAEDLLFNLKLVEQNADIKIHIIENITYFYYQNMKSITHLYKTQLAERYANCVNDYKSFSSNDNRGITYLVCNAVNCICAQEKGVSRIHEKLRIFIEKLDASILKANINYQVLGGLPFGYKIDYGISYIGMKKSIYIISIYQGIKNFIRGR